MTEGLADAHNRATEGHVHLYRRWSEGGAGLLISGNVQVDRWHLERPGNVAVDQNGGLEQLTAYAKAGTVNGNHLWMQISHAGRQTPVAVNPSPLAPSAVPLALPMGFGQPREMSEAEILDVIERFGRVAATAKDVGFTGVQVHGAHGYLLSQFLNPLANRRTDCWGGPLENRARLLLEVIRKVRTAVGPSFPVAVKLNSADFQKGGFSADEAEQVVRWLDAESVDFLEISGGSYEQPAMVRGVANDDPARKESARRREAYFLEFASRLRPAASMAFMVTGGFRSHKGMEEALKSGDLDVVGIARPFCTEPDLPNLLLAGTRERTSSWEATLRLDHASLPADLDESILKAMEGWSVQGWFCVQLLRMGRGENPDPDLPLSEAFAAYQANEAASASALVR